MTWSKDESSFSTGDSSRFGQVEHMPPELDDQEQRMFLIPRDPAMFPLQNYLQGHCMTIRIAWSHAWLQPSFPMFFPSTFRVLGAILTFPAVVSGLGSSCSAPLGAGTSASTDPYWLQGIKHQGTSPFNGNPSSYAVFRNVKVWHESFGPWSKLLTVIFSWRTLVRLEMVYTMIPPRSSKVDIWLRKTINSFILFSDAISAGNRCGGGSCRSSTLVWFLSSFYIYFFVDRTFSVSPAVVYFPKGWVSEPS